MIDGRAYDASNHATLVKNQDKMPWKKLVNVLNSYLDSTEILFRRSEVFINPERRIQGVRINDKTIKLVSFPCLPCLIIRRLKPCNERGVSNVLLLCILGDTCRF